VFARAEKKLQTKIFKTNKLIIITKEYQMIEGLISSVNLEISITVGKNPIQFKGL
jgi:hypothetical protein